MFKMKYFVYDTLMYQMKMEYIFKNRYKLSREDVEFCWSKLMENQVN